MNRIFDAIDWMLQHHPFLSIALIFVMACSVNVLVPPP